ncbi:hypothetical protein [Cupriavidus pauculus]|uniref:Carboxypeptidase regulatory-like domain-containing protein n=1 Tax=Cupriavidus pauculus TaxID=82633 RepID=A0A2N5C7S9_9BURK|nr:hypothetical protein [Cupriavidus pauculus]PLP98257.1 hypothetical protein CYJ10_22370 [Cupriavidus pauculus]
MKSRLLLTGLAAVVLTACGGGGGDSAAPSATPQATSNISGTVAVGAALPAINVTAKCARGSGTATTAADGTFKVSIADAVRPCVLSVAAPDGSTLHSVVPAGSASDIVANITPLTELITAALAQGSTAQFATLDAASQARLTEANLATALALVKQLLSGSIDLGNLNPIKDPLVAATSGQAGNALDQLLDKLAARLAAARTSVGDLSAAVGANGNVAGKLQPGAETCNVMKTAGEFFVAGQGGFSRVRYDTATAQLSTLDSLGNVTAKSPFMPYQGEACRYIATGNGVVNDVMVSRSGLALMRNLSTWQLPALMVPAQQLSMSELAGKWNAVGFERAAPGQAFYPTRGTFTINASGQFTAGADCAGVSTTCSPWAQADLPVLTQNAHGDYTLTDPSGTAPVAAFKDTDGTVVAVVSSANGLIIATKQVVRPMPTVGSTNAYWDVVTYQNLSAVMAEESTVIQSVDTLAGSYTRKRVSDGRVDTWTQNSPSIGLRYRAGDNLSRKGISLTLGTTGVGAMISLDNSLLFYDISVSRPQ